MTKFNQKGIGALPILLLIVIVGLIGGTGYFVYQAQKDTNKSLDNANKTLEQLANNNKPDKAEPVVQTEDSWLLFTAQNNAYSFRVPDGWQGLALNDSVFIRESSELAYEKGTLAKIEILAEGGWDGPSPFALYLPQQNYDQIVREGTAQGEIKTNQGLIAHKFVYTETLKQEAIGYQQGDTVYNYYFDADGKYIQVSHYFPQGGTDQHEMVERAIRTIKVN